MQTPIFDTGEEQAAYERGVAVERARHEREQNSRKTGPAADIKRIKPKAKEIVENGSIGSRDRMVHLKVAAGDLRTEFTNQELNQYIWDARRELAGAAKPVPRGGKLSLSKARWLWTGVVIAATTTLVVALPKVGKSRLMTMMLWLIPTMKKKKILKKRPPHTCLGRNCLSSAGALPGTSMSAPSSSWPERARAPCSTSPHPLELRSTSTSSPSQSSTMLILGQQHLRKARPLWCLKPHKG